jgi:hypothetical protein
VRRKFIDDALEGKVGAQKMFHDVTMDELARYALAYFGGEFKQQRIWEQFVDRGMSYPEVSDLAERYLCSEPGLCPGPDKCEHKQFILDDQPYCTKQKTRGNRQPVHIVNCTEFYMLSQHDRNNTISLTGIDTEVSKIGKVSQRSEVKGYLSKGKGIYAPNLSNLANFTNLPNQPNQVNNSIPIWEQNKISGMKAMERVDAFHQLHPKLNAREIGDHLGMSVWTVRNHQQALKRLGRWVQSPQLVSDPIKQEPSEESDDPEADAEHEDFQRRANQLLEGQDVETTEEEHF